MIRAPRTPSRLAGLVGLGLGFLLTASPGTASGQSFDYVAMGDSYSSGTGTRDYYEDCERSFHSYSHLIDPQVPGNLKLIACGGARTSGVSGQANQLSAATDHVTISIGGNDAGFSDVLLECGQPSWSSDCDGRVDEAQAFINDSLPGLLNGAYSTIRSRAPNAAVTVVGYPRIFNGEDCNAATFFSGGEMTRLNQTADLLADVTRARAQAHGFGFADARGAYLGHAVCDDTEWLNGLSNPVGESFHPNKLGHSSGYAGIVRSALLAQESPNGSRGPNGRIAFTRGSTGGEDVWAINGSGAFPVNLTPGQGASDIDPAFSPDGTRIAFASDRDGDYEIYAADSDGSDVTKLTSNTAEDREPAWSPNGDYLAFRSARDGNNEIYKMTATGGSQSRLTANGDSEFAPAWSPDGAEIAYQRFGSQNDVWKMNSDGQGQTRLTTDGGNDGAPEYSPNGSQIAFHSNRDGDFEIFTMSATGGSQTQRTSNGSTDQGPVWSPNGASIAFSSNRDAGDNEIYTMTSTGASQTRRTTSTGSDVSPSWQGDKTTPQTSITEGPQGTTNNATPAFTLASDELGSTFECRIDSGSFAPCSSPHQTGVLAEGTHVFRARAIDPSGNADASPAERTFTIEAPVATAITAGPSGPHGQSTATFEFDAADPDTAFVCRVDEVIVANPCSSPYMTPALAEGPHVFRVTGTDGVNSSSDESDFVVDTVAPDTSLASGPGNVTNQTRPGFELAAEPGSTFECRLDEGAWEPCVSPFAPSADLEDGDHVFEARATDPAGNAEAAPLVVSFAVDTVAPGAAIDDGPPAATEPPDAPTATNDPQPEFEFSSPDPAATTECRLDSLDEADWSTCTSPYAPLAPLEDGSHVFEVRAVDAAGNAGEPASRRFVVDATAPATAITGGPEEGAEVQQAAFTFEADDPDAEFRCSVDGSIAEPCDSGAELPGLSEGAHEFEVYAVDQLGNVDVSPAERSFTIDRTAPGTTIDEGPAGPTNDPTPTFGFDDEPDDDSTFECRVDGGAWSSCTDGTPLSAQSDGQHTFEVRAVDAAGNRDGTPASRTYRVDTVAPSLTIVGPAVTNDTTPTFELGTSEELDGGFECSVDSAPPTACPASFTTGELTPNSEHTLAVTGTDLAGNGSGATKTFRVDTVPPNATAITSGPPSVTADPTPTFEFNGGSETNLTFECRAGAGAYVSCSSPWTTPPLPDGPRTVEIRAVDAAGNRDVSPASRSFTVDTTAPTVSIDAGPRDVSRDRAPSFSFSADGASRFECALDDAPWAACTSPHSPGDVPPGDHTFAVRAFDAAGNEGPAASRRFTVAPPAGEFSLAKPKPNPRKGTAGLPVTVSGPGKLELSGDGVVRVTKTVGEARTVKLRVAATGAAAARLRASGAVRVVARVRFAPADGDATTKSKRVKLILE